MRQELRDSDASAMAALVSESSADITDSEQETIQSVVESINELCQYAAESEAVSK